MTKMLKTLFVSIASLSLISAVNAGELTVSGTAKATYLTVGGGQQDNSIGVSNELNFTASGELDNGYSWSYSMELDPSTDNSGAAANDDTQLSINTNGMGTVKICVSECGNNAKYAFDKSVYGSMTDTGFSEGIVYPGDSASYASIQYHSPELPFGTTIALAHGNQKTDGQSANAVASGGDSISEYAATISPVDGLTVKGSYYELNQYANGTTGQEAYEHGGAWGATYAAGAVTIGYGKSYKVPTQTDGTASGTTTVEQYENTGFSIGYAVNDALSVSYTQETGERSMQTSSTATYDIQADSFQLAYTAGGLTLGLARTDYENVGYVQNHDVTETVLGLTMAF